jgi:xanthine dehydrogenase accessory factor
MKRELLNQILNGRAAKIPVAVVTFIDGGAQHPVYLERAGDDLSEDIIDHARQALHNDRSGMHESSSGKKVFIQVFNPPLRLIVVGAVHITQALVPVARLAGYEVIVVDPRRAWTTDTRFPDVTVSEQWPDEAMLELDPDMHSAIVTLSHDPKLDDPALHIALRSPAFYIGSLGSKRTHAARLQRLREAGFGDENMTRIHAPIGLDIGAKSPAEIAIAIMAQITQARHR